MTISTNANRNAYTGNAVTTSFAYTFGIYATTEINVWVAGSLMGLGTDYTITGGLLPTAVGGNVVMTSAPANGASVVLVRAAPFTQPYDPKNNATFDSQNGLEPSLDELAMQIQQLYDQLTRTPVLKEPTLITLGVGSLPDPVASTVIGWNPAGTGLALYTLSSTPNIGTPVVIGATDQGKAVVVNTGSTGYVDSTVIPFVGVLAGGTTNYTLSISPWSPAYDTGNLLWVRANATCAATPTLNISPNGGAALGAKNIVYQTVTGTFTNLAAGDLINGNDYILKYSASQDKFIVLAPMVPSSFNNFLAAAPVTYWNTYYASNNVRANLLNSITGMALTSSAGNTTMTVPAGTAMDSTGVYLITIGAFTKLLAAVGGWTAGTGGVGNTANSTASATWHIFLIGKSTDLTAADIFFDTSVTAGGLAASAAGSAGFNIFRRIGSWKTDGSKNWVAARGYELSGGGLRAELDVPVRDFSTSNPGTSAVVWTTSVPTGLKFMVEAIFGGVNATTNRNFLVTSPDQTDSTPTTSLRTHTLQPIASPAATFGIVRRMCSATATLRYRVDVSDANLSAVEGYTLAWEDSRHI